MPDPGPIFVVGAPRSGTTLLKDILDQHPDVQLFDELHFFERLWDGRSRFGREAEAGRPGRAAGVLWQIVAAHGRDSALAREVSPEALADRAAAAGGGLRALLGATLAAHAALHGATRWGDSSPQDVLYLDTLLDWYPEARVVAMVRDPRGYLASYKNFHRRAMAGERERFDPLANSLLWRSYMNALERARSGAHGDAIQVQHYEALTRDPMAALQSLCAHVGLDPRDEMLEIRRANSSYAPGGRADGIFTSSRERWRHELSGTEQWLVERICDRPMRALGYTPEMGGLLPPSIPATLRIASRSPRRAFDSLFRGRKPFRVAKLRRVLARLRD